MIMWCWPLPHTPTATRKSTWQTAHVQAPEGEDECLVDVNRQILPKEAQTSRWQVDLPYTWEILRQATSLRSQRKQRTFSLPFLLSLPTSLSLSFEIKYVHIPKLSADTAHGLSEPLPPAFRLAEQILSCPLWSTIRYCTEQAGTCFQKAAGPGDHVSLLDTINWVMSQSHNEDKFWCLL